MNKINFMKFLQIIKNTFTKQRELIAESVYVNKYQLICALQSSFQVP